MTIMITMGNSQNFFLTRRNAHSSAKIDIGSPAKIDDALTPVPAPAEPE